jgi:hypothetical protein
MKTLLTILVTLSFFSSINIKKSEQGRSPAVEEIIVNN